MIAKAWPSAQLLVAYMPLSILTTLIPFFFLLFSSLFTPLLLAHTRAGYILCFSASTAPAQQAPSYVPPPSFGGGGGGGGGGFMNVVQMNNRH